MRKRTVAASLLGLLLGWVAFTHAPWRGTAPRVPPDIVLIVWDTCRPDRLSTYGHGRPTTPFLDEFAGDAVLFRNAHAPAPWTPPSHASLFTGLLPWRHGLTRPFGPNARVRPGLPLLAETLAKGGYETVGVFGNPILSAGTDLDAGFARTVPFYEGQPVKGSGHDALEALEGWIGRRRAAPAVGRRPLFLFVNLMETHIPRAPRPEFLRPVLDPGRPPGDLNGASLLDEGDLTRHSLGLDPLPPPLLEAAGTLYDGACREVDDVTRRILALLETERSLDDALIAVTSDHGEALGEHGLLGHRLSVHDTVLRIPLVVRWKGHLDGGRVEDAAVRLQDLYPTVLEAAGLEAPPGTGLDARTLTESPLAPREVVAELDRSGIPFEKLREAFPGATDEVLEPYLHSFTAVQDPVGTPGARKYVRVRREGEDGETTLVREELHDLAEDPGELRDLLLQPLAETDEEALRRLRARVESLP